MNGRLPNQWAQNTSQLSFGSSNFNPGRVSDQAAILVKRITLSPADREDAIHQLSCYRESIPSLGLLIWESPAAVLALLEEIFGVIPQLASVSNCPQTAPTSFSPKVTNRVCNSLALLQSIAINPDSRDAFLRANIPMYLVPFLHTTNQSRECEHFKLAALGVIGNIARSESPNCIEYLINNEFIPLCLRVLKFGQDINKIIAAFILQKILTDHRGKVLICGSNEKISAVVNVLNPIVKNLSSQFNPRLSRNIVIAYEALLSYSDAISTQVLENCSKSLNVGDVSAECDEPFRLLLKKLLPNIAL